MKQSFGLHPLTLRSAVETRTKRMKALEVREKDLDIMKSENAMMRRLQIATSLQALCKISSDINKSCNEAERDYFRRKTTCLSAERGTF